MTATTVKVSRASRESQHFGPVFLTHVTSCLLSRSTLLVISALIISYLLIIQIGGEDSVLINEHKCECGRTTKKYRVAPKVSTTCDSFSTSRGSNQKVVSYSYYGDSGDDRIASHYLDQIKARAKEVQNLYPGFIMRLYYHLEDSDFNAHRTLCQLWCQNQHLDLCNVNKLPLPLNNLRALQPVGRTWRFAVMMDPLVETFLSRDLDSMILEREVAAVKEWLGSNETFHIMRDHPSHNGYMLAGLWGGRRIAGQPSNLVELGSTLFHSQPRHYWDFDQALLRRIVWPEAVKNSVQHDSYSCNFEKFNLVHHCRPFPTKRQGKLYVGWGPVKGPQNKTGIKPCPKQCRPNDNQDWIFC